MNTSGPELGLNEAEQRFAAYLDAHGYRWRHEPDYQAEFGLRARLETQPDFLFERRGSRAVGEVRQFETTHIRDRLSKSGGYGSLSPQEVYGSLRSGVWEKCKQLRPLSGAGVPLLVVLANPLNADVMLDPHHVQAAMWGNPRFVIPIDTTTGCPAEGHDSHWRLEDYGVFASPVIGDGTTDRWENRHPHVTAVLVVHERLHAMDWRDRVMRRHRASDSSFEAASDAAVKALDALGAAVARGEEPKGAYRWVTVYEVNGDEAVPLPVDWFRGPRDERYGQTEGGYGRLPSGPSS